MFSQTIITQIIIIALVTLIPTLELRASIPYGIFNTDLHWTVVFLTAVSVNILLGSALYIIIDKTLHFFIRFKVVKTPYDWYHKKVHKKIHNNVEKYGELGLALFIGVPLPGSGSYSGALAAHLLGMDFKKFFLSNLIGVLIAGVAVLLISFFGSGLWTVFLKVM